MVMEIGSQWYNRVASDISTHQLTLGPKDAKKYRLDQLLRIAKRVDEFSDICEDCQSHQREIDKLLKNLNVMYQMPDREKQKEYFKKHESLTEHLKKFHKLVDKGHYMGMGIGIGMAIGVAIGSALGAAFDSPGIGTGIGAGLGMLIGVLLDKKARDEGKVI